MKEEAKIVSYHPKLKVSKYVNSVMFGRVEVLDVDEESKEGLVKPIEVIDEFTFYYLYCTINNIVSKDSIANTQLLVLSAIMCKPLDFNLPTDSKDNKLKKLAEELSEGGDKERTPNSIYQSAKRLRDKGYLVETEDRLVVPNAKLQYVRQIIKKQLKEKGFATFDYLFKCFVSDKPLEYGQEDKPNN